MSLQERFKAVMGVEEIEPVPVVPVVKEEEVVVVPDPIDPYEHEVVVAQGEAVASELELVQLENDIDKTEEDIDDLEDRVEDLEARIAGMEAMMKGDRPWNPELAQHFYAEACKTVGSVMGAERVSDLVKGNEAFADVKTAQIELVEGLAQLQQRATDMNAGLEGFFANLYDKVVDWLATWHSGIDAVEKSTKAILTKVGNANPKGFDTYIRLGAWNRFLDIEKHNQPFANIDKLRKPLASLEAALKSQNATKFKSDFPKALNEIVSALSNTSSTSSELVTTTTGNFNGHTFKVVAPNSGLEDAQLLRAIDMSSVTYKENLKAGIKLKGHYESSFGRDKLMAVLKEGIKEISQVRQAVPGRSQVDSIRKSAENVEKKAEGDNASEEIVQDVKELKRLHAAANKAAKALASYFIASFRAANAFAEANVKKSDFAKDVGKAVTSAAAAAATGAIVKANLY